jgi:hypothetical protein
VDLTILNLDFDLQYDGILKSKPVFVDEADAHEWAI